MQKVFWFAKRRTHLQQVLLFIPLCLMLYSSTIAQQTELKIDPLMFVALKEARNITQQLGANIFPGWSFASTPVLFYRPNVQEILINFPHKPKGFKEYQGFNPSGLKPIYYRNDTTFFTIDGQNTRITIDNIDVLVVADRSSNLRNNLLDVALNRPREFITQYFDSWAFLPSGYDDLLTILHEGFHVHQYRMAPKKLPNEVAVMKYPVLNVTNNALSVLEGNILRDALLAADKTTKLKKAKQFVAVRSHRQSLLGEPFVEYENLNEYNEGIAKYVEYAVLAKGSTLTPIPEMYFFADFSGYGAKLTSKLREKIHKMTEFVSVSTNAFENKYGTGPVRFKLYHLGACLGLLLDDLLPSWKEKIFQDNVYLSDLLRQAVFMGEAESQQNLQAAKTEYTFDRVYQEKLQFQKEGEQYARQKANVILQTSKTLITIVYKNFSEKASLYSFTPFGVTTVNTFQTIFDLVPVEIGFQEGVELKMKLSSPVIIDKEKKNVFFASTIAPSEIHLTNNNTIDTPEFTLFGAPMEISITGNIVTITLKK